MKLQLSILLAFALAAGCAYGPQPPPRGGAGGGTPSPSTCTDNAPNPGWLKYGDSQISAKKVTNIKAGKFWRIHLQPDAGYENAVVTVTGKNPTDTWISASGKEADSTYLKICVPGSVSVGDQFYYMVTVQFVGQLDPRADVVN